MTTRRRFIASMTALAASLPFLGRVFADKTPELVEKALPRGGPMANLTNGESDPIVDDGNPQQVVTLYFVPGELQALALKATNHRDMKFFSQTVDGMIVQFVCGTPGIETGLSTLLDFNMKNGLDAQGNQRDWTNNKNYFAWRESQFCRPLGPGEHEILPSEESQQNGRKTIKVVNEWVDRFQF